MDMKLIVQPLLKGLKLKIASSTRPLPQDGTGLITLVCKTSTRQNTAPSVNQLKSVLAGADYGQDVTVEDLDIKVSPLRLVLGEKAFYVSIFLSLNVNEEPESYTIGYSTQGKCLHIIPIK